VLPDVLISMAGAGILTEGAEAPKGFMDVLPDPMKVDPWALLAVMVLVTALFVFLKYAFFKPILKVMDDRDADIQSGTLRRAEAASLVEARQADYAARLKEFRGKAFEHRKALATAASQEKAAVLERARQEAGARRTQALAELKATQEQAKTDLMAQVDALSETMVAHLLRQA